MLGGKPRAIRFAFVSIISRACGAFPIGFRPPLLRVCKAVVFVGLKDPGNGVTLASAPVIVPVKMSTALNIRTKEGIVV